ncbi:hypothetical protein HELRODRAFT_157213 [Helobdella robusta]|uniref:AAA+ ATPase domain-containing protein n=1 Tax=Helobdella robusta TaxID=6412 RepID=T1EM82_HELRO|nr:hypothetical protein HELRODRAFT_157213 [Helobdella robusta]ESO01696.1 hypothetical protein HELRODRAFT_157213 [Helobdella robusta]
MCSRGILISGPNGCGKNTLARCIAAELDLPLVLASGRQLMVGVASEKSENVQKLFDQAISLQPCLILIDDIDLIDCKNETASSNMDKPVLNNLLINIDRLNHSKHRVWLIGLAGKRENVDSDLLRDDRFDDDYHVSLPDASNRTQLLKIFVEIFKQGENCLADAEGSKDDEDFKTLSFKTPSYSCRDLRKLVKKAILQSLHRQKSCSNQSFSVDLYDFEEALCIVKPTTMVEDTISIPEVTWKDIGALQTIREELVWSILNRIKNPVLMAKCGPSKPKGVMLFGPPGCGKTLVAKALANEASINFLSVKGPELIDKFVGESERNIRSLFQRAKECSPCLIFFDEIDSISERRSFHAHGGGTKVVQQLLTVLDGVENRDGVFVMGATNRLDCVDPAFLRGNRFGNLLYVGLPSAEGRLEILRSLTKNGTIPKMAGDVSLEVVANDDRCNGLTGADLSELVDLATMSAWKSNYSDNVVEIIVTSKDFENALSQIRPSVSSRDLESYEKVARQFNLKNFRQ